MQVIASKIRDQIRFILKSSPSYYWKWEIDSNKRWINSGVGKCQERIPKPALIKLNNL
jgi:hypothetical protein